MSKRTIEISAEKILDATPLTDYDIKLQFYIAGTRGSVANNNFILSQDILHYVRHFKEVENYSHKISITGKEPTSRPIDELERVIQKALNTDTAVELRTNAAWVHDKKKAEDVWNMLSTLKVPKKKPYNDIEIAWSVVARLPSIIARLEEEGVPEEERNKEIDKSYKEAFPDIPLFTLSIFVDNTIHDPRCMHYFEDVVSRITNTPELSDKINLQILTLHESWDWFRDRIFGNKKLNCTDIVKNGQQFKFKQNGYTITGTVYHTKGVSAIPMLKEGMFKNNGEKRQMVLHFYPDQKVSFGSFGLVSYINDSGKYKPWETLRKDMAIQVIKEDAVAYKRLCRISSR